MPEMLWFRVCVYYVSFYTIIFTYMKLYIKLFDIPLTTGSVEYFIILLVLRALLEAVHNLFILHPRLNEISNF